jgi:hypothetical protein
MIGQTKKKIGSDTSINVASVAPNEQKYRADVNQIDVIK